MLLNNTRENNIVCCRVDAISEEEFEAQCSRTEDSGGGGDSGAKPPVEEELQFSLDEQEEGRGEEPRGTEASGCVAGGHFGQPLTRLAPDKKSRFYPVPWKNPILKDGKVCLSICLSVCPQRSQHAISPLCMMSMCYRCGTASPSGGRQPRSEAAGLDSDMHT